MRITCRELAPYPLPRFRLVPQKYQQKTDSLTSSYWDWSVDWQDLAGSSIWDNEDGFGRQDGSKVEVSVPGQTAHGKCVSGPFKDVILLHYNLTVRSHCLSRQFELSKSEDHGTFSGELMSPDAMGQLARSREYGSLRFGMEGIHDVIHNGVIGDLNTWSSANGKSFNYSTKEHHAAGPL